MNENWPRWIWASVTQHFNTNITTYPWYFEGHDRIANAQKDNLEFRMDGPFIQEESKNFFKLDIEINVLVTSIKDDKDAHKIHKCVGLVAATFTNEISVYKYGNGLDDNRLSLLGCLILQTQSKERINITHFGIVQPTNNIMQATVEGHYRMILS